MYYMLWHYILDHIIAESKLFCCQIMFFAIIIWFLGLNIALKKKGFYKILCCTSRLLSVLVCVHTVHVWDWYIHRAMYLCHHALINLNQRLVVKCTQHWSRALLFGLKSLLLGSLCGIWGIWKARRLFVHCHFQILAERNLLQGTCISCCHLLW